MKMEQTECSETSEFKIQTPGNNPKESIQRHICYFSSLVFCWMIGTRATFCTAVLCACTQIRLACLFCCSGNYPDAVFRWKRNLTTFSNYDVANIIILSSRHGMVEHLSPGLRSVIYWKPCVTIYIYIHTHSKTCLKRNAIIPVFFFSVFTGFRFTKGCVLIKQSTKNMIA